MCAQLMFMMVNVITEKMYVMVDDGGMLRLVANQSECMRELVLCWCCPCGICMYMWVMHTIEGVYKCMAFQSVETEPRRYVVMRSVHY